MTYLPPQIGKAMTATAAVLAFTSTPLMAQDSTPPVDTIETPAETPAADPLAPEADTTPVVTDTAAPPASKPKVETTRAKTSAKTVTTRTSRAASATRPAARRASATAPTAAPVAAAATAPPAAQAAPPPVAVEPAPAPVAAEPVQPSEPADNFMTELMDNGALPIAAGALGLLAVGGTALAMRRRKRRREEEDYLARQQALDAIGDEPPELELDRRAEVAPTPAFTQRPAPVHDPIPDRAPALARQDDADFMFRRVHKAPTEPVEPN